MVDWVEFENEVRDIASRRWGVPANKENICGINLDCVMRVDSGNMIIVEITKNNQVEKVRGDIKNRLDTVRDHLYRTNRIFTQCYLVCGFAPTSAMMTYANELNVKLMTNHQFRNEFLNYSQYSQIRKDTVFGSAFNPVTGEKDRFSYIKVAYMADNGDTYKATDIVNMLLDKRKIVLMGDYGTGKSKCIEKVFNQLAYKDAQVYSINIRDMWGLTTKSEIIQRHVTGLGLSALCDPIIRMLDSPQCCMLLDGFDEIGSQMWGTNITNLKAHRCRALAGIHDIIQSVKGGLLIAGREQYFNSTSEMLECLGLSQKDTLILRCPSEFTDNQMIEFIKRESNISVEAIPINLPRRPLMYSILAYLDEEDVDDLFKAESENLCYWDIFLDKICIRESRISRALLPETIKDILIEISNISRIKSNNYGPITMEELSLTYQKITQNSPTDESAIILQRLPGLGLVDPTQSDRQFIDSYILNGLRATHVIRSIRNCDISVVDVQWTNVLDSIGLNLVIEDAQERGREAYIAYLKANRHMKNGIYSGELLKVLIETSHDKSIDFFGSVINGAYLHDLDFSNKQICNLTIENSIVEVLNISNCTVQNVSILNCDIERIQGIGSLSGMPLWIHNCNIDQIESIVNTKKARSSKLTIGQVVLLTILQKTFFQRGNGRQEAALFRGLSGQERLIVDDIIRVLDSVDTSYAWISAQRRMQRI